MQKKSLYRCTIWQTKRILAYCIYTCLRKLQYVRACFPRPPCVSKRHLIRSYSGKRWVPQRVKSLSTPLNKPIAAAVYRRVSIGCIHASFRSRLMRDLNNIRVTAWGRRRKKVKGHSALPIDERTGAKKGFVKHRGGGDGEEEGEKEADELKNFPGPADHSIFNETRSPPRYFFISTFSSFRDERGMQPRERRPVDAIKKKRLCTRSLVSFYYTYTQGWQRYF